ncbi:hypothetical protein PACILC2_19940 [Paenibacillus cisolokensis]|uniref:Uncharacterized protein n=1 Tax=Paenibacillus cisolokensis TaxID=1658519 RepID=A0ABQ4N5K3_9BACL|nr:hypothetical protein [Paenibacillus cisolokensis]GIQ63426.1 hypothetical protein PACILC2_19940 [Paenibacillus cisolokensis]
MRIPRLLMYNRLTRSEPVHPVIRSAAYDSFGENGFAHDSLHPPDAKRSASTERSGVFVGIPAADWAGELGETARLPFVHGAPNSRAVILKRYEWSQSYERLPLRGRHIDRQG